MSILDGVNQIVDDELGVTEIGRRPHFTHQESCQRCSGHPPAGFDGGRLVDNIVCRLEQNWKDAGGKLARGKLNWHFRQARTLKLGGKHPRPEKTLEKYLAQLGLDWLANQVVTSSGVVDRGDTGRNVDLVCRDGNPINREYRFIELKVDSDQPLYAAIECLGYGLVYVFSRIHAKDLGYDEKLELMRAQIIHLRTLAPPEFYRDFDLRWLETALTDGLASLLRKRGVDLRMDFRFDKFPLGFDLSRKPTEAEAIHLLLRSEPVYSARGA
jgi:hypothetical protein